MPESKDSGVTDTRIREALYDNGRTFTTNDNTTTELWLNRDTSTIGTQAMTFSANSLGI